MKLGLTFKTLRENRGLSLLGLYTLCIIEIPLEKLVSFEDGESELSKEELEEACNLLNITPAELALRSLEIEDVPEEKQAAWDKLKPLLDDMFNTLDDIRNGD
jgi:hypothetical protein